MLVFVKKSNLQKMFHYGSSKKPFSTGIFETKILFLYFGESHKIICYPKFDRYP